MTGCAPSYFPVAARRGNVVVALPCAGAEFHALLGRAVAAAEPEWTRARLEEFEDAAGRLVDQLRSELGRRSLPLPLQLEVEHLEELLGLTYVPPPEPDDPDPGEDEAA